jgi:VanZ family protein
MPAEQRPIGSAPAVVDSATPAARFVDSQWHSEQVKTGIAPTLHGLICVCIVLGMLAVGLGPFRSPRNGVSWLRGRSGVRLGRHASILSEGTFGVAGSARSSPSSLEIWLRPDQVNGSSAILAFSSPSGASLCWIQQYFSNLLIIRKTPLGPGQTKAGVENVLHSDKAAFVTITSGARGSEIYVDGVLAGRFPEFSVDQAFSGRLIIGTAPEGHHDWHGDLFGLALYDRPLAAERVLRHYQTWTRYGRPDVTGADGIVGLYLFNERAGNVIHNVAQTGLTLNIPEKYTLLHRVFLQPFWTEYRPSASYYIDLLINLIGFIPLGLIAYAYWMRVRPIRLPTLATIGLGFAVSATIEIVQYYLPTRNSGTTDLITNTIGTYLGVKLYTAGAARILLKKLDALFQA